MSRALKAVAWDIDGTLIDSEPAHHLALVEVCAGFGLDLTTLPEETFLGVHVHDVWRTLRPQLPEGLAEAEWLAAIEADYARRAASLDPRPGAVETVRALHARGVPQCAVSNSSRIVVDANIAALGLSEMFEFTLSLDDFSAGKPSPEPYLLACDRMKTKPSQTVAVEDSPTGARSARLAGLLVVGVGPEVAAADLDAHIHDVRAVAELLGG